MSRGGHGGGGFAHGGGGGVIPHGGGFVHGTAVPGVMIAQQGAYPPAGPAAFNQGLPPHAGVPHPGQMPGAAPGGMPAASGGGIGDFLGGLTKGGHGILFAILGFLIGLMTGGDILTGLIGAAIGGIGGEMGTPGISNMFGKIKDGFTGHSNEAPGPSPQIVRGQSVPQPQQTTEVTYPHATPGIPGGPPVRTP